ncbi:MAG: NAD(P)/FAD-dependent oxidoreductase, partial [Bacteriovoracaceae bacterium]|nr:NAD(P)/FAD-dependent oxidoreductase [Bacteriovoracaceae bacterium]
MNKKKIFPVTVIGGGSAGVMAALRCVLNNDECLFFPGAPRDKKRSRAFWVSKVENMPAHFKYSKGIDEPNKEVLDWIEASSFNQKLLIQKNTGVENLRKLEDSTFEITDSKGVVFYSQYVILCTGVMDVQPKIGSSISPVFPYANLQTIDYCLRCDGHHILNKQTAIIGHANSAAWVAIMLFERYKPQGMYILTNGETAQFEKDTLELLEMYGIKIHTQKIEKILGDTKSGRLAGFKLEDGMSIHAEMSFVSLGMIVYNDLAKQLEATLDNRGFVIGDAQGQTNVSGFFVAGDVMAGTKKQIYTAWDTAVNAADAINQKLRSETRLA